MSEEILKALMQLFGLIAKQDGGAGSNEADYVQNFLEQQLNAEAVEEYFAFFLEHATDERAGKAGEEEGKIQLTSVKDSVRILGICKKINKQLNREQKVVVLVRLYELVNADRKFTDQRMAIINTVAEVFKFSKDEFTQIEAFVLNNDIAKLDYEDILVINDKHHQGSMMRHIQTGALDGDVLILRVKSSDLYFLRYTGTQDLFLNGLLINSKRIYLFAKGSFVRLPIGKPVYYTDVVSHFMSDVISEKISYVVDNVGYKFKSGGIGLRNINLTEEQGKLIGIMGASGAGKTTLLNVLCGIETPTEGRVLINGYDLHREHEQLKGIIGYIPQDDLLIEELTVFENLYYNAKLCFKDMPEDQLIALVDETLQNLGLFERKHLKVGSPLNKMISGGQRKRLNIALELIRKPGILFVDEPTSGLSSRDSENVMNLLQELTLKGKLIFVVIHQPSSDIYKMFDKMFILDTGGYPVYYGNPGESLIYFKRLDLQVNSDIGECPTCGNLNPELIFNIIDANVIDEYGNYTNKRKKSPEDWHNLYKENIVIPKSDVEISEPPKTLNIPGWFKQFWIYTLRDFFSKISNTQYLLLNLLEGPLLGFILAYLIRYIVDPDSDIYIFRENENIPPYIFMGIVVALFFGLIISAEEIFKDAKILKREAFLNLSRSSYLASKILIIFTISAIQMALFVFVGNSIIGFKGMNFEFWLALFSLSAFANVLGLIISASFNSIITIYILIPLLLIPQMVLGGAMFTFDKLNRDLTTSDKVPLIAEFMPSRWIYEGLIVHQFVNNKFKKSIFDVDLKISYSDFRVAYLIPELEGILESCENYLKNPQGKDKDEFVADLALLKNEISSEIKVIPDLQFDKIDLMDAAKFDSATAVEAKNVLENIKKYYNKEFSIANNYKEKWLNFNISKNKAYFEETKDAYFNEKISDVVCNLYEKNKLLRDGDKLIQNVDPIYQMPVPTSFISFRTHFFSPKKYFAGKYFNTLWFNICIVWIITSFMYLILYLDLLKKGIDKIGDINFTRIKKRLSFKNKLK